VGKPEEPESYVPVVIGEWGRRYGTLYVAREIWERLRPHARTFTFYLKGPRRCRIHLDHPVGRLER
jgi:hypothetical protein